MHLYNFFNVLEFKLPSVCKETCLDLPCKAFIITKPDYFGPAESGQHLHGINIEHCDVFLGKIVQNVKEYRLAEYRGGL